MFRARGIRTQPSSVVTESSRSPSTPFALGKVALKRSPGDTVAGSSRTSMASGDGDTFYSSGSAVPKWGEITGKHRVSLIGSDIPGRVVPGIVPPHAPAGTYRVCGGPIGATCGTLVVTD